MKIPVLSISVCSYQNGDFDVILQDGNTGEEVTLSGHQTLTNDQLELTYRLAPACVMTRYVPLAPPPPNRRP